MVSTLNDGTVVLDEVGDEIDEILWLPHDPTDGATTMAEENVERLAQGEVPTVTPGFVEEVVETLVNPSTPHNGQPMPECVQHANARNPTPPFEGEARWWIRSTTIPTEQGLDRLDVTRDLIAAWDNWQFSDNVCGFADDIRFRHRYSGWLDHPTGTDPDAICGAPDGYNMVDFGVLRDSTGLGNLVLAKNCTRRNDNNGQVETDVKFNRWDVDWFVGSVPTGCDPYSDGSPHSVENIMTHEVGHTLGLGHVVDGAANLTMYPYARNCSRDQTTLGWGDIKLARELY